MDPITAIGFVASLTTIVDFAIKIATGTYEVYDSVTGTTIENTRVEDVLEHLKRTTEELQTDMLGKAPNT
jgi:hypothetical protein